MSADEPQWWKMNAGDHGGLKDEWLGDKIISIGWDVGDFRDLTGEEIRAQDTSFQYQLSKFIGVPAGPRDEAMNEGDFVIACAPEPIGEVIGVGRVKEARYEQETSRHPYHPNVRDVDWLESNLPIAWDEVPEELKSGDNKILPTRSLERFRGDSELLTRSPLNVEIEQAEVGGEAFDLSDVDVQRDFNKLTGPIEHWVTTYNSGFWGFRPDKEESWKEISPDEVFLFHAAASEIPEISDVQNGVIGLGVVGAKSEKQEPVWWGELHSDEEYPYLIHFSEIYWFGDTDNIRDAPVAEKDLAELTDDCRHLAEDVITFSEMNERTGYQIPAQGSPVNVNQAEKLFPLIEERLQISSGTSGEDGSQNHQSGADIRGRSRNRNFDTSNIDDEPVKFKPSIADTIAGTLDHEEALDTFEDHLEERGFQGGETDHSDLIVKSDSDVLLTEAKSIHEGNERSQIRRGVGQLLEYRHIDINQHDELDELELTLCLLLTQPPSEKYREVLESILDFGIYTYWIDEEDISGLEASMAHLNEISS